MERYEARFCRSSIITSFAANNSWNFSGRRGVNYSTALRILLGSNTDILRVRCDNERRQTVLRLVGELDVFVAIVCLWVVHCRDRCHELNATADCSWCCSIRIHVLCAPRSRLWTVQ